MGKELKAGSQNYFGKGLKMLYGFVDPVVMKRYKRKAKAKGWSVVQLVTHVLIREAPKR